jgi:NAD(P)-dependent dehydrogenase (short-subunit alcohol dehydrogenase family)
MGVLDDKVAIVTGTSRGVGVGIAHELLGAGAAVVGCSRSPLDAIPGVDAESGWAERSHQMVCDQGDYHAITDNFRSFVLPKDDPTGSMSTRYRSSVVANPPRSAARVSSSLPAQPISSMARRSKSTAACCRACSTTPD